MAKDYNFQYTPLTGRLPGNSFVKQTEQAINELAGIVNEGAAQVEVITNLANQANDNSEEALEKATEALETSGRVYITLPNLDDADDYFDSQLYYFANSYSANLPVQDTGFLEVKTNDTKTAAEQVFIADDTGLCYFRHGVITATEVGDETVYSVTWETWSSALASQDYVQQEVNTGVNTANDYTDTQVADAKDYTDEQVADEITRADGKYLPLAGGIMTGDITFNKQLPTIAGNGRTMLTGGTNNINGSSVQFYPYNYTDANSAGTFVIRASNKSSFEDTDPTHKNIDLVGKPNGSLSWGGVSLTDGSLIIEKHISVSATGTNHYNISAPAVSGYQFVCWVMSASFNGIVGTYIENAWSQNAILWCLQNVGSGVTFWATALYVRKW